MTFSVKAMSSVCLNYAPIILPENSGIAQAGSVMLFSTFMLGSIVGACPLVAQLGPKISIFCCMLMIDAFLLLLTICASVDSLPLQWALYMAGNLLLGFGTSILMTAICVYMARIAAILAKETFLETLEEMTAHLGGSLAVWSLSTAVFCNLAMCGLVKLQIPYALILGVATVICVCFTLVLLIARDTPSTTQESSLHGGKSLGQVYAFFSLWRDPKLWLLGFTNYTFSFIDALLTNHINPRFIKVMLGPEAVGLAMCVVTAVGAILAKPYSVIGAFCGRGVSISIGAFSFFLISLLVLFTDLLSDGHWWVLIIFICHGSGRAVYEGVNRAVFAEHFEGVSLSPAFANCNFQYGIVAAFSNLGQIATGNGALDFDVLLYMSLLLAALTGPCFWLAARLEGLASSSNPDAVDQLDRTTPKSIVEASAEDWCHSESTGCVEAV